MSYKEKEYKKRYDQDHKEQIKEYNKQYYQEHKEQIKSRRRLGYEDKEKRKESHRRWLDKENEVAKKYIRKSKTRWTAEEDKAIIDLREVGITCTKIAIALGRSRKAVMCRIAKMHKEQKAEAKDDLM